MRPSRLLEEWSHCEPSDLAAIAAERRGRGLGVSDMVTANPHDHGLVFPPDRLATLVAKALPGIAAYRPDPHGRIEARESVAEYEAGDGAPATAENILLTPGTSFAYFLAFRLLLDGGGEVLVPRPTYPLFDDLARVAGARTRNYHLRHKGGSWALDPDEVEFQLTPATQAIALVSPHHPTGLVPGEGELAALGGLCARRGIAVIVDEVFREFLHPVSREFPRPSQPRFGFPLVLTLNGISKMFSLPGWKGGWISLTGEPWMVEKCTRAFAYATDAFLPVSDPTAALMPLLFREAGDVVATLAGEVRRRQAALGAALEAEGWPPSDPQGGVHRVVRLPPGIPESWAAGVLGTTGWLVHPGGYYGVGHPAFVISCIRRPEDFPRFASAVTHR